MRLVRLALRAIRRLRLSAAFQKAIASSALRRGAPLHIEADFSRFNYAFDGNEMRFTARRTDDRKEMRRIGATTATSCDSSNRLQRRRRASFYGNVMLIEETLIESRSALRLAEATRDKAVCKREHTAHK